MFRFFLISSVTVTLLRLHTAIMKIPSFELFIYGCVIASHTHMLASFRLSIMRILIVNSVWFSMFHTHLAMFALIVRATLA